MEVKEPPTRTHERGVRLIPRLIPRTGFRSGFDKSKKNQVYVFAVVTRRCDTFGQKFWTVVLGDSE